MPKYARPDHVPSEVIRTHGWCQGFYTDAEGHHCFVGAIEACAFDWALRTDYLMAANGLICSMDHVLNPAEAAQKVIEWNDLTKHTVNEVLAVMDAVEAELFAPVVAGVPATLADVAPVGFVPPVKEKVEELVTV